MAAIEEYAIEASAAKVFCSEVLDRTLDRCLQWHGGYGFVELLHSCLLHCVLDLAMGLSREVAEAPQAALPVSR